MININDNVNLIKGIGAKKTERINSIGIYTVSDLLEHFPIRYRDRRSAVLSNAVANGEIVLVEGELFKLNSRPLSRGKSIVECQFKDEGGVFIASFFNMPYLKQTVKIGTKYSLYGEMRLRNNNKVWTNPEIAECGTDADKRGIIPVYRCTQGITNNDFYKWNRNALDEIDFSKDWLDDSLIKKNKLCSKEFAYRNIHFPLSNKHYQAAKYRLTYDQLLIYQLAIRLNSRNLNDESVDASISDVSIEELVNNLPFNLTDGQQECIKEIESDLVMNKPMNRLIQGDVGCGKTVVAEAAIFKCVRSGYQAAMMAPTEILARQHYARLSEDLSKLGIKCALLVSGLKASERRAILEEISSGEIAVIIGTHAIIQDDVLFNNLALVVTDEQHRFGVNQRKQLVNKGRGVNVCVMSATPIPRTLAATVYGDMDFSVIKTKPASRLPIITKSVEPSSRERAYVAVREQLEAGHQAYVIAPSINSEDEDLGSVEQLYEELSEKFSDYKVELLHGKLNKDEKELIMNKYAAGKIDILVATVVIEVGIDVPNATIIVLENSERYGLAQMHQLRGRVGRSKFQSYCYLVNYSKNDTAVSRAKAMVTMSDGFEISEEDYRLRGPGDIMGTMQSGNFTSHILSLCNYKEILDLAIKDADAIMNNPGETDISYAKEYLASKEAADNSNIL